MADVYINNKLCVCFLRIDTSGLPQHHKKAIYLGLNKVEGHTIHKNMPDFPLIQ